MQYWHSLFPKIVKTSVNRWFWGAIVALLLLPRILVGVFMNYGYWQMAGGAASDVSLVIVNNSEKDQKKLELAETAFRFAYDASGYFPEAILRGLGFSLLGQGDLEQAVSVWSSTEGMAVELVQWGITAERDGRDGDAIEWYKLSHEVDRAFSDSLFLAGNLQLAHGHIGEAEGIYERAVETAVYGTYGRSDLLLQLVKVKRINADYDVQDVLALLNDAISQNDFFENDSLVQAHFLRGELLREGGLLTQAEEEYAWIIRNSPNHYWAHVRLGMLTWRIDAESKEAESLLHMAININPNNKWAYRTLGTVYQESGQIEQAIKMYQEVLRIDKNDDFVSNRLDQLQSQSP